MNDYDLIDNILPQYHFLKEKCIKNMAMRGGLPNCWQPYNITLPLINDIVPTVTCSCDRSVASSTVIIKCVDGIPKMNDEVINMNENYRIRKLTPNEYWKLMGLTDEDCEKARAIGVSDSQLYKQAGNGLVTNCVQEIMEHLYKALYDESYVCTDENFQ